MQHKKLSEWKKKESQPTKTHYAIEVFSPLSQTWLPSQFCKLNEDEAALEMARVSEEFADSSIRLITHVTTIEEIENDAA